MLTSVQSMKIQCQWAWNLTYLKYHNIKKNQSPKHLILNIFSEFDFQCRLDYLKKNVSVHPVFTISHLFIGYAFIYLRKGKKGG